MSKLILKDIISEIKFESLPLNWQSFRLDRFSKSKNLYDFQQDALKSALKVLWRYYDEKFNYQEKENLNVNLERKKYFFEFYKAHSNYPEKSADYDLSKQKTAKLLREFYEVKDEKVSFENFVNQMGFWMATGSGKTLVIVKLIEILKLLMERKEIPLNDILFLTYRDDLIEQFRKHIDEFNSSQNALYINIVELKRFPEIKRGTSSIFKDKEINVFYYRSDNVSVEQKEKKIDFKNYENNGAWYILLDEAHKGDKEDSLRQIIYQIMARNGFLFNFSATFVDPRDFMTTGFAYNLSEFIRNGYGKCIYLSQEEIKAFKDKEDFSQQEKQKIILKSLLLLCYVRKFSNQVKKFDKNLYHIPLLLVLVNSVNVEDADLKLFFKELEKIAKGQFSQNIFDLAKDELKKQFELNKTAVIPEGEKINIDEKILQGLTYQDILQDVFNSNSSGSIEVLVIPGNKKEMVFKLRTTDRPFALIKIGDISDWVKWLEGQGYDIIESFDNESVFQKINEDDSDINILMGSRTFYEGWDSNRPNIILYINIGVGSDAKKFVLQSTGRGVRIEPIKNERKRLLNLYHSAKIQGEIYKKVKDLVLPLETLFIFGTNVLALKEVIKTFEEAKGVEVSIGSYFVINKDVEKYPLFVPVYKPAEHILAEEDIPKYYTLSEEDFNLVKSYCEYLEDDRVILMYYESTPKVLKFLRESFQDSSKYYKIEDTTQISNPEILLSKIISYFSLVPEQFNGFEKIDKTDEKKKFIVHFEKIRFNPEKKSLKDFLDSLEKVKNYKEKEEKLDQLSSEFESKKIKREEFTKLVKEITEKYTSDERFNGIIIKYVPNHYYCPIVLSAPQHKIDYLNHIIKEESEVKFINELDKYLSKQNNLFEESFEWWFFSKLDEVVDEVYIPWYNPKTEKIEHFKPDFIFWLKEKDSNNYHIVFVDPKGTEHTEAYRKIDGYIEIFENKVFKESNYNIRVHLFCKPKNKSLVSKKYKDYWEDDVEKIFEKVLSKTRSETYAKENKS